MPTATDFNPEELEKGFTDPDIKVDRPTREEFTNGLKRIRKLNELKKNNNKFPRYTFSDLKNFVPNPDNYLAGTGWLRRGASCLITGGTGVGKSIFAEQIVISIATGINILGCIPVPHPQRVVYIQAENDVETLKRDFLSICDYIGGDEKLLDKNLAIHHNYGQDADDFAVWFAEVVDAEEPVLVVIDPYQNYIGGADMNSSSSFLSWMRPINAVIVKHNIGLLLVAHSNKPQKQTTNGTRNSRESVYAASGTSTLANWARTSAEIYTVGEEINRFELVFGKNAERNGLTAEDNPNQIIRSMYIQHSNSLKTPFWTVADDQDKPSKSKYRDEIIEMATLHPSMSYANIAEAVGCSKTQVSNSYPEELKEARKK